MSSETLEEITNNEEIIKTIDSKIISSLRKGREAYNRNDLTTYRICQKNFLENLKYYEKMTGELYVVKKKDYQGC